MSCFLIDKQRKWFLQIYSWRRSVNIVEITIKDLECYISSVQSLSHVQLFATPWTTAHQAFLSITNSWSPPKPMSIVSVMPSNHLILCRPLLLLPSVLPRIRVFSNESALHVRWPKYWSFSFNISPSNEHPGLISFKTLILLDQGSILMTLFNLNYLSKGPMSKYSHVGGLGF